jgi:hypothetical protein
MRVRVRVRVRIRVRVRVRVRLVPVAGRSKRYTFRMTCPMTARLETTIFSVRSLNLHPGAIADDGKGSAGPNRLPGGAHLTGPKA